MYAPQNWQLPFFPIPCILDGPKCSERIFLIIALIFIKKSRKPRKILSSSHQIYLLNLSLSNESWPDDSGFDKGSKRIHPEDKSQHQNSLLPSLGLNKGGFQWRFSGYCLQPFLVTVFPWQKSPVVLLYHQQVKIVRGKYTLHRWSSAG